MSAWSSQSKTLPMKCLQAFWDAYTIIQNAYAEN